MTVHDDHTNNNNTDSSYLLCNLLLFNYFFLIFVKEKHCDLIEHMILDVPLICFFVFYFIYLFIKLLFLVLFSFHIGELIVQFFLSHLVPDYLLIQHPDVLLPSLPVTLLSATHSCFFLLFFS